jgi:chromate transporter
MNKDSSAPSSATPSASSMPADTGLHISTEAARPSASLTELTTTFLVIGATSFGGMWGASQKLEDMLITRKGWLTQQEQQTLMIAATLIPAPKFLAFGGLVGYQLRGWIGSAVTMLALIAPGSAMVLIGAMLLNPQTAGAALGPISDAVEIGVIGVLFGNAYHQWRGVKVKGRRKLIGGAVALGVAGATAAGMSLLVAAALGLVVGALALREPKKTNGEGAR